MYLGEFPVCVALGATPVTERGDWSSLCILWHHELTYSSDSQGTPPQNMLTIAQRGAKLFTFHHTVSEGNTAILLLPVRKLRHSKVSTK